MKHLIASFFISLIGMAGMLAPVHVGAQAVDPLGLEPLEATELGNEDIRFTVASIINVALSLIGMVLVVIIIYAGFQWMTAGGNSDAVSDAKGRLMNAIIGLLIVLSAYAITEFVVKNLFEATTDRSYVDQQ